VYAAISAHLMQRLRAGPSGRAVVPVGTAGRRAMGNFSEKIRPSAGPRLSIGALLSSVMELPDTRLFVASSAISDGPSLDVDDPWSGERIASVTMADRERAEQAVVACVRAFDAMRRTSSHQRREALRRVARAIDAQREELAELIAWEAGKPLPLARSEVARGLATFELGAEEATRLGGEVMPLDVTAPSQGYYGGWSRVPAGPVLAIAPFNFPLNLVAHKIAPALACGCSVLLKPPPQAPLTSLALGAILREAEVPDDAVQILPCDVEIAEALVRDDRFATLSFTGSAKVGWHLKSIAGKKRVLLELGGNAAAIVHEDASERAAAAVVASAFGYAGQVCIKTQRLYLHSAIADRFLEDIVGRARALRPEEPRHAKGILGPMIDEANARRVEAWVEEAQRGGAEVLVGGRRDGARHDATILEIDGAGLGMKVVDEEVFGPVLTVHVYDAWEDALGMADATKYGLQAGIFTDSQARVRSAYERLHVGGLIVNDTATFRVDAMPYGGTRDSGLGREGVRFAMEEMTERKALVVRHA
jgi:acyl-CoA reductase-like NAD-dependent aldehyde dehydrogenase